MDHHTIQVDVALDNDFAIYKKGEWFL